MKKKLLLLTIFTLTVSNNMDAIAAPSKMLNPITKESQSSPRAEETKWCYRIVNGQLQKRLYSITYGKWLTDWINL